jgi:hypothetical protein
MSLRNRIVGWLLKAAGLGATITGLSVPSTSDSAAAEVDA